MEGPDTSHLESVVSQWPKYKKLMSHPAIGVCMGLPWEDEGDDAAAPVVEPDATGPDLTAAFQLLVEVVARRRRTVPSEIDQDELRKATQLDLGGDDQVHDAVLAGVAQLTGLTLLDLRDTEVTGAGMKSLEGLTGLTRLFLSGTQVTDAGMKSLEGLTGLTRLFLSGTQVTDAGLTSLEGLTGLKVLGLDGTQVTDAGVARLKKALPKCMIFR